MTQLVLKVQKRKIFGRKTKTLRREGFLPANVYGKKVKSLAVQTSTKDFIKLYKEAGETNIINLKVEKESKARPVLASNLQKDPVTDLPLHIDFHQVDLSQKVTVAVPIEITGESLAVKEKGAVLITLMDDIRVEALPKDLPDKYIVNINGLKEFNDSILIKDLGVDKKKVAVQAEEDEAIIMVQEPKKEDAPEVKAEAEPEETPTEEGEAEAGKEEEQIGEQKKPAKKSKELTGKKEKSE